MSQKDIIQGMRELASAVLPAGAEALLFGSRARGDARADSDWDVVVLLDKPKMSHYDRYAIACELWDKGFDIGEEINTLVYTKAQWNDAPPSLFKYNVREEGIQL